MKHPFLSTLWGAPASGDCLHQQLIHRGIEVHSFRPAFGGSQRAQPERGLSSRAEHSLASVSDNSVLDQVVHGKNVSAAKQTGSRPDGPFMLILHV